MRDAFSTALKLLLAVFLLAVGVAALDLRVIQPFRTPPCNPETLEEGHVCLSQVLKEWPGKILWIDARKQDDFERHTVTQAPVYPIRPADAQLPGTPGKCHGSPDDGRGQGILHRHLLQQGLHLQRGRGQ